MRWKKIFIAVALLIVVFIVGLYAFLMLYDFNKFKPMIAKAIKDASGRELAIAGNIEFEIGIRPTLIVEDVSFQNSTWSSTPDLARVKKMEVQIAVLPLVIGKFDFAHLVLIDPTVIVEFDKNGISNFSFDTGGEEQDETELFPPPLIFGDIRIENGHFTYRDAQSDFNFTVRIDHLTGEIPGFDEPLQLDFKGAFNDIAFALRGTVGPIWAWVEPGYELPVDVTIAAGGATARVKGEMRDPTHLKDLAFTVTAEAPSTADMASLVGATGVPELGAFKLTVRVTDPETNVIAADGVRIALGENQITGLVKLNLAAQVPFLTAQLSAQKSALGPVSLDLYLTDPLEKPAVKKFDLKFGTEDLAQVRLSGGIGDLIKLQKVDIDFQASGKDLANLERLTGQPMPVRGTFSAAGKVLVPVQKKIQIPNLKISAGKNNITGSVDLDLSGDQPRLSVKLASPKLNLPSVLLPDLARQDWARGMGLMHPVKLSAQLAGFNREMALEKIDLQAGIAADSAEFRLNGSVGNLLAQRGIDLKFSLRGDDVEKVKDITGQPYFFAPVPGEGAYALSGRIRDQSPKIYKVEDVKFEMSGTVMTGSLDFNLNGTSTVYDVSLVTPKFNMKPFPIPKEKAYAKLNQIEDLGSLKIQSQVVVAENRLSMPSLRMQAGQKELVEIEVKGSIKNLTTQTGIDLDVVIQGDEIANLKKITDKARPFQGAYGLSARLTDLAPNHYKLDDLKLTLGANSITGTLDLNLGGKLPALSADLAAPQFTLQPVTLPALAPLARIEDLGPLMLKFKVGGAGQASSLDSLDFKLGRDDLIEVLLKGTIRDLSTVQGMDLDITARGSDMSNFNKLGGPQIPFTGGFEVTARINDPEPKIYKIPSLDVTVADNHQTGWLELDFNTDRPRLKGELSSEKLDLRPLLAEDNAEEIPRKPPDKPPIKASKEAEARTPPAEPDDQYARVFSAQPLQFQGLQVIDADLKFREKQVLLPNLALDDVILDLQLQNGDLKIKPFEFSIGGGKADVQFALQSQNNPAAIAATIDIDQLAIGPMFEKLGYPRKVEGNLNADVNLDSTGNSVAEWMAGLDGSNTITVSQGRMTSAYLELLQKYLGSGIFKMINPFEEKREYTPVNCFVNMIEIEDGLADVKIMLDTDQTTIIGMGDINLKTERLDLGIKPTPKKGALPADISFSFKQLSQPFRLGGTLASPRLALDPRRTALVVGKLAGALALGPVGIAAFFADISAGKQDACEVAMAAINAKDSSPDAKKEGNSSEVPRDEKQKEEKSGGFFRRLFGK
ncbi:MAG: AsmA family protein [Deltaproteobacteria bacterium]|jgi:uncharacterized protein involved in outer membrane biogenesis|nr:AsmA family protein [Deltaproteobacteria bacterium]